MELSEETNFRALLTAVESRDVASTTRIWRGMTSVEQEAVVFRILGMHEVEAERTVAPADADTEVHQEFGLHQMGDETAIPAGQTELIPKSVEDLRGLTGSDNDTDSGREAPDVRIGSTEYWSQWRQRWKWSVLVTVWAMATIFAFNGTFDSFGPMEWVVGIAASVMCSGLLIGTLVNFAVALMPRLTPKSR